MASSSSSGACNIVLSTTSSAEQSSASSRRGRSGHPPSAPQRHALADAPPGPMVRRHTPDRFNPIGPRPEREEVAVYVPNPPVEVDVSGITPTNPQVAVDVSGIIPTISSGKESIPNGHSDPPPPLPPPAGSPQEVEDSLPILSLRTGSQVPVPMDDGDDDDPIMRLLDREISGSVNVQVSQQYVGQQQNNIVHVENAVFATQVNPPAAEVLQGAADLAHMAEVAARDREIRAAEMAGR